jgi:membrane protease YdiL (CAAX protease family)
VPIRDTARRLRSFIVSIMPADRAFFFLLLGSTLLFISSSLGWWDAWQTTILESSRISGVRASKHWVDLWSQMLIFAPFPIRVAGAAGFFVSFFPGRAPLRRLHLWVYLPAAIGLALTSLLILAAALAMPSTMNPWGYGELLSLSGIAKLFWNAGPGLHFTFLGLICVALSASRIRRGLAVLPIHLESSSIEVGDISLFQHDQRNWMRFVWVAITLMNQGPLIAGALIGHTIGVELDAVQAHLLAGDSYPVWFIEIIKIIAVMIVPAVFLLLVLLLVGGRWREVLRSSLRLPLPEYFGIALFLPVAIYSISLTFPRVLDRLHGINSLPLYDSFFALFLLALVEEIAWRGYLQPRFIARFGLYRGIFFVGIVWAAFHFSGDFRSDQADTAVFRALVERLLGAILLGFALSWLTLRSKSVLPAAVTHTAVNRISTSAGSSFYLALVLWAVADLLLFRFWPPRKIVSGTSKPFL